MKKKLSKIEALKNGEDPCGIIIDLEHKIEELNLCIEENATRSQRMIFDLESKNEKLEKEIELLKGYKNGTSFNS